MPGNVDSKDVKRLTAALKRFPNELIDAGQDALEETTKQLAKDAKHAVRARPGGGSYKREPGAYRATKTGGNPGVSIQGGGTAIAAEYGTTWHTVFGDRIRASTMKRRVFGAQVSGDLDGYVVGKLVKRNMPGDEKDLAKALDREAERQFKKAGL